MRSPSLRHSGTLTKKTHLLTYTMPKELPLQQSTQHEWDSGIATYCRLTDKRGAENYFPSLCLMRAENNWYEFLHKLHTDMNHKLFMTYNAIIYCPCVWKQSMLRQHSSPHHKFQNGRDSSLDIILAA